MDTNIKIIIWVLTFLVNVRLVTAGGDDDDDENDSQYVLAEALKIGGLISSAIGMICIVIGFMIILYQKIKDRRNQHDKNSEPLAVWATPTNKKIDGFNGNNKDLVDVKSKQHNKENKPQNKENKVQNKNINQEKPVEKKPTFESSPSVPPTKHVLKKVDSKPDNPPPYKEVETNSNSNVKKHAEATRRRREPINYEWDVDADAVVDSWNKTKFSPREKKQFVTNQGLDIDANAKVDTGLNGRKLPKHMRKSVDVNHGGVETTNSKAKVDTGLKKKPKRKKSTGDMIINMPKVSG